MMLWANTCAYFTFASGKPFRNSRVPLNGRASICKVVSEQDPSGFRSFRLLLLGGEGIMALGGWVDVLKVVFREIKGFSFSLVI